MNEEQFNQMMAALSAINVLLLRQNDILMTHLAQVSDAAAAAVDETHTNGGIYSPPPWLADDAFGDDEDEE